MKTKLSSLFVLATVFFIFVVLLWVSRKPICVDSQNLRSIGFSEFIGIDYLKAQKVFRCSSSKPVPYNHQLKEWMLEFEPIILEVEKALDTLKIQELRFELFVTSETEKANLAPDRGIIKIPLAGVLQKQELLKAILFYYFDQIQLKGEKPQLAEFWSSWVAAVLMGENLGLKIDNEEDKKLKTWLKPSGKRSSYKQKVGISDVPSGEPSSMELGFFLQLNNVEGLFKLYFSELSPQDKIKFLRILVTKIQLLPELDGEKAYLSLSDLEKAYVDFVYRNLEVLSFNVGSHDFLQNSGEVIFDFVIWDENPMSVGAFNGLIKNAQIELGKKNKSQWFLKRDELFYFNQLTYPVKLVDFKYRADWILLLKCGALTYEDLLILREHSRRVLWLLSCGQGGVSIKKLINEKLSPLDFLLAQNSLNKAAFLIKPEAILLAAKLKNKKFKFLTFNKTGQSLDELIGTQGVEKKHGVSFVRSLLDGLEFFNFETSLFLE